MPHVHNALHHFTEYQNAFRRAVGEASADFAGIERAGETIQPVLDLWSRPEWAALRGEVLWNAYHEQAAVAAEFAFVGIRNPAGSGLIAVVERASLVASANDDFRWFHGEVSATDVDGSEQLVPRDTRFNLAGVTRLVKIHGTGAGAIGSDALETHKVVAATGEFFVESKHVLTPGFELRLYMSTVNLSCHVWMQGYVRLALPGEL